MRDGFSEPYKAPSPASVEEALSDYVIGQKEAKRALSVVCRGILMRREGIKVPKTNLLFAGPTGSGKTHIVETLSDLYDIPVAIADASALTAAGYRGEDVEQVLERLIINAGMDTVKAEYGIVFFDEFDKLIGMKGEDNSPTSVQAELLKMVEGEVINLNDHGKPSAKRDKPIIDTSDITFIFAGAFTSLTEKDSKKNTIGFASDIKEDEKIKIDDDAFVKAGILPELYGRIGRTVLFQPLTKEDYIKILTEKKDNVIDSYKAFFDAEGVEFTIDCEAIEELASMAVSKGYGARGLKKILSEILEQAMYDVPSMDGIEMVKVTRDSIRERKAVYEFRNRDMEIEG